MTELLLYAFLLSQEPRTGLEKPFPEPVTRPDNPTTPERVELGRLLFFDPILSGDNDISCAHCHHPDLAFTDGLPRGRGKGARGVGLARSGGNELGRATPTLWNALYNARQFWDGRASDLEEQARGPITDAGEMAEDPARLVAELRAISRYRELFDRAFGGTGGTVVTFENALNAIAAFERTLVSRRSRFDLFAAGDADALTAEEKRGVKLFFSTKTRCAECHGLPNFANRDFKVVGVPDPPDGPADAPHAGAEPGRGGGPRGAFKVPTLRNVALTAPYMHNGTLRTLEDVVDFYAKGGGRGRGLDVPLQDDKVRGFDATAAERGELVAFLRALTDESAAPEYPADVPSGLPVAPRVLRGAVVDVREGQSIQAAIDAAGRGARIRVHPGVYREDLLVIHHDVTIEGIVEGGRRPVLDGGGVMADGIVASGRVFTVRGLEVRNYRGNGIVVRGSRDVRFEDLVVSNPGLYGVYPVECEGVLVEGCKVTGARDAGIYVGQSRDIEVRRNDVSGNVAGIEIENSTGAVVEENDVHGNTGGILVFLLPFNPSKEARRCRVARNRVHDNNVPNFAERGATVANVLQGTGILVLAADETEVTANEVSGNGSAGVSVSGLYGLFPGGARLDVDPFPDSNRVHGNVLRGNGLAPDPRLLARYGLPGRDLLWDGTGKGNAWDQPGATAQPEKLPGN